MKKAALLAPLMLALMVASCSWLPDSSLEYRKAAVTDPIKVPEGGVFIGEQPLYAVPRQDARLTAPREDEDRFHPPRPPQLVVLVMPRTKRTTNLRRRGSPPRRCWAVMVTATRLS